MRDDGEQRQAPDDQRARGQVERGGQHEAERVAADADRIGERQAARRAQCSRAARLGTIRVANTRYTPTSCTETVTASANSR